MLFAQNSTIKHLAWSKDEFKLFLGSYNPITNLWSKKCFLIINSEFAVKIYNCIFYENVGRMYQVNIDCQIFNSFISCNI